MKLFLSIIGFLLFSFIAANSVKACSCRLVEFEEAAKTAASIFVGKVVSIEHLEKHDRIGLKVRQSWKGDDTNLTEVLTKADSDACGYFFEVGKSYLIYASKDNGTFRVSSCSRTRLRKTRQAKDDIKQLNGHKSYNTIQAGFAMLAQPNKSLERRQNHALSSREQTSNWRRVPPRSIHTLDVFDNNESIRPITV